MNNLLNKDGCRFRARIEGVRCTGRIYVVDNNVYLLQNMKDGGRPRSFPSELGFEYSWDVDQGTEGQLECYEVEDLEIIEESPIIASSSNLNSKKKLLLFL